MLYNLIEGYAEAVDFLWPPFSLHLDIAFSDPIVLRSVRIPMLTSGCLSPVPNSISLEGASFVFARQVISAATHLDTLRLRGAPMNSRSLSSSTLAVVVLL